MGPHFATGRKIPTPATSEYKDTVFSRISLIYYLFLLKNDRFKFVKPNFTNKVYKLFLSVFKAVFGSMA